MDCRDCIFYSEDDECCQYVFNPPCDELHDNKKRDNYVHADARLLR